MASFWSIVCAAVRTCCCRSVDDGVRMMWNSYNIRNELTDALDNQFSTISKSTMEATNRQWMP